MYFPFFDSSPSDTSICALAIWYDHLVELQVAIHR